MLADLGLAAQTTPPTHGMSVFKTGMTGLESIASIIDTVPLSELAIYYKDELVMMPV